MGDFPIGISDSILHIAESFVDSLSLALSKESDLTCLFGGRQGTIAELTVKRLRTHLSLGDMASRVHTYIPQRYEQSELPELEYSRFGAVVHAGVFPEQRREALVRDADLVLLMGTGRGIYEMARISGIMGRFIIPVPLAGGPAVDIFSSLLRRSDLNTDFRFLLSTMGATESSGVAIANAVIETIKAFYKGLVGRPQVFLAMPFIDEFVESKGAESIARSICEYYGLNLYICRDTSGIRPLITEILNHIDLSAVLIAYLDHERPNVYFEAGYAWGKDKPVILCIRDADNVAFDVSAHEFLCWSEFNELFNKLSKRIEILIQDRVIVANAAKFDEI